MNKYRCTPEIVYEIRDLNKNKHLTVKQIAEKYELNPAEVSTIRNLPDEIFKTEKEYFDSFKI